MHLRILSNPGTNQSKCSYLPWRAQRGLRPQPKVAITLRRDEHLSVDIHQPRQFSMTSPVSWPEGQSARALHSGGPVQCSSRRSVTATFRFYPYRVRTLVRTKLMHENNLDKSPPGNLRGATRNQLFSVLLTIRMFAWREEIRLQSNRRLRDRQWQNTNRILNHGGHGEHREVRNAGRRVTDGLSFNGL